MPAITTEITEIVTGLGMFDFPNLGHALEVRPAAFRNVPPDTYDRLMAVHRRGEHGSLFATAWDNGVRFARSPEGLRGRPVWEIEWKGGHKPPGYEQIPADLRVDHVYLVSCKYGSSILTNSSPANLFENLLATRQAGTGDWFLSVAGAAYQRLYEACRVQGGAGLPERVDDLTQEHRDQLKRLLPRRLRGEAQARYRQFASAVAEQSSRRWQHGLVTRARREEMVWRLLRLQAAPYFVLGQDAKGNAQAYRVATPWDLRAEYRFRSFEHWGEADAGQPIVGWSATFESLADGRSVAVRGHIEVRWSHGKFARPPEAKVYLDTPYHEVPGYVPLELPGSARLFA